MKIIAKDKYSYTTPVVFSQNALLDTELNISRLIIICVLSLLILYWFIDCIRSYVCHFQVIQNSLNEISSDEPELLFV